MCKLGEKFGEIMHNLGKNSDLGHLVSMAETAEKLAETGQAQFGDRVYNMRNEFTERCGLIIRDLSDPETLDIKQKIADALNKMFVEKKSGLRINNLSDITGSNNEFNIYITLPPGRETHEYLSLSLGLMIDSITCRFHPNNNEPKAILFVMGETNVKKLLKDFGEK